MKNDGKMVQIGMSKTVNKTNNYVATNKVQFPIYIYPNII